MATQSTRKTVIKKVKALEINEELLKKKTDSLESGEIRSVWVCKETQKTFDIKDEKGIEAHVNRLKEAKRAKEEKKRIRSQEKEITLAVRDFLNYSVVTGDVFRSVMEEVVNKALQWENVQLDEVSSKGLKSSKKRLIEVELLSVSKEEADRNVNNLAMYITIDLKADDQELELTQREKESIKKALAMMGWEGYEKNAALKSKPSKNANKKQLCVSVPIVKSYDKLGRILGGRVEGVKKFQERIWGYQFKNQMPKASLEEVQELRKCPKYVKYTEEIKSIAKKIHELRKEHAVLLEARKESENLKIIKKLKRF